MFHASCQQKKKKSGSGEEVDLVDFVIFAISSNDGHLGFSIWPNFTILKPCSLWPRGYKTFFMLNSVEHEILNTHKYKNIKKFVFFRLR